MKPITYKLDKSTDQAFNVLGYESITVLDYRLLRTRHKNEPLKDLAGEQRATYHDYEALVRTESEVFWTDEYELYETLLYCYKVT